MKFIVLLRGINVGGRKIKMDELRSSLEKGGYQEVQTVLQTGNVILTGEKTKKTLHLEIEHLLQEEFNYPARVLVLTMGELAEIIADFPFPKSNADMHRYIVFTEQKNVNVLMEKYQNDLDNTIETIAPGKSVVYWQVLKGHTLKSTFGKNSNKTAAHYFVTNRNINTLEKILKKRSYL